MSVIKQKHLCYINTLKLYHKRKETSKITVMAIQVVEGESENGPRLSNSMILKNLQCKLEEQIGMK